MNNTYPFELPPLPYAYDALEPYIDAETMHFHHDKHLKTYVDNLNNALAGCPTLQNRTLESLILCSDRLQGELQTTIKNNAGGVCNHILYFNAMAPASMKQSSGSLMNAINQCFGSFDGWKDKFKSCALNRFGSGYAWLATCAGRLVIVSTANQDTIFPAGLCPILLIDVWEHAYYLKYQNRRAEYIENWFNVVNWDEAQQNYEDCTAQCNG